MARGIETYIRVRYIALVFALLCCSTPLIADEIRIAVASNFSHAMKAVAAQFEKETGHRLIVSFGSTGKHYAHIRQGAPFDAFFAADSASVERLLDEDLAITGSDFTYAQGKLILWSPNKNTVDQQGRVLCEEPFRYLAIANPRLAPYGRAAQETLENRGLWQQLQPKLVRGGNIAQTFQFVLSGNAQLGLVAASQLIDQTDGSSWEVPESYYSPIIQRAVQLRPNPVAKQLLAYFKKSEIKRIIANYGYLIENIP